MLERELRRYEEIERGVADADSTIATVEGILVNLLNPKVPLFFLAFFPQFVSTTAENSALQFALLGISFTILGAITDVVYAFLAGSAGGWLKGNPFFRKFERFVSAGIYITLGATSALVGTPSLQE